MGLDTSAEHPAPVRTIAHAIGQWVGRLGPVWVEGQITQLSRRPGAKVVFLTLRDPAAEISLSVTAPADVVERAVPPLAEGARVVVHARPDFYLARGTLSLAARDIRSVGLGELLARLEKVKAMLAAEGLFDVDRKRPLPFVPRGVGLVCGRASAAERDVVENARRRWPSVRFQIEEVAVQGPTAVSAVSAAVERLDRDSGIDVIVIARGGGSVEDLLPFSDEQLVRVVSRCATPVVSAIGHEPDIPLLDLVADVRASTPTDAARRIVPDVGEQQAAVDSASTRLRRVVEQLLAREMTGLQQLRQRPVLADPMSLVAVREDQVGDLIGRARRQTRHRIDRAIEELNQTTARVRSLSPAATLARGYAVVQTDDGSVVRQVGSVTTGQGLQVRVSDGTFGVRVDCDVVGSPS
ncbi:MAG: exodeoxyribonuclease VII large subunit [Actinomycetes bacterium]